MMGRLTKRINNDLVVYTQGAYTDIIAGEMTSDDVRKVLKKLCEYEDKEYMTNADRIRNMPVEELAEFLDKTVYYCRGRQESKYCDECPLLECGACNEIVIKEWLQAEVKEGAEHE